jgi:two-component SAPR family response regulator
MIDLDPLDEQSYKKLIDIYQSEDNSVMAKRYYEELKDNLKKELILSRILSFKILIKIILSLQVSQIYISLYLC